MPSSPWLSTRESAHTAPFDKLQSGRLAEPPTFGYDTPAMDPADQPKIPVPFLLAPGSQTACYQPWLKVSVALRSALTFPWTPEASQEVRQRIPWLLAE